jgi:serine/threonine protein kinase
MLFGLATGLAEALTTIHAAGIMHRDLKPSNIILTDAGPKVIDFGIARRQDTTAVTRTGMMIGSMGFMAPEQISGHPGPEADIFAWGVTVAYAAGGRSPFGAGSTHSVLYRIMYGDADIASVPDSLLPLVEASLAKDPQSRPSAQQLLDRLTSGSSRTGSADDTTQVILARTWQSGSHASPPADRPVEANQVPPREPAAPSAWPHVARPAAQPPAAQPPAGAPPAIDTPAVDTPTADAPSPVLPPGMVPSAAMPSAAMPAVGVSSAAAPVPAAQAQASEKVPVGRRMATIATSALVAMRLRRPGRPDEPKS